MRTKPSYTFFNKIYLGCLYNILSSCTALVYPWVVPNQYNIDIFGDRMLLIPIDLDYKAIYSIYAAYSDPSSSIN